MRDVSVALSASTWKVETLSPDESDVVFDWNTA